MPEQTKTVGIVMPADLLSRVEREIERRSKAAGCPLAMGAIMKALMAERLDAIEEDV